MRRAVWRTVWRPVVLGTALMRMPMRASILVLALAALTPAPAFSQDVVMLGRQYGTQPPPAYFDELARDPGAYRFRVEGADRLEGLQRASARTFSGQVQLRMDAAARSLGPRAEPLLGTFRFPVVLGLFSDTPTPPAFSQADVQRNFFDGPGVHGQTLTAYYAEMSRGLLRLEGVTTPWVPTSLSTQQVTLGNSGLSSSSTGGVGAFIEALVQALDDQGMDWSSFDQTGDGYVDLLTVIHPVHGAECGGEGRTQRIWSHRWNIDSATRGRLSRGIPTRTPGGPLGVIHIMDYTIQPLLSCLTNPATPRINEIGVFAHELGHGFGLPDLYGTRSSAHTGVGTWDLMAMGTWGCQPRDPARPCPLGAWSRAMLGWANIVDLAPDVDHGLLSLPPSLSTGTVFRVPGQDGTGTHLLLENRQPVGLDANLMEPGLLIWQIDEAQVQSQWSQNAVNAFSGRLGVRIRTASGRRNLEIAGGEGGEGANGTRGDIHPGCIKDSLERYLDTSSPCAVQTAFHLATPSAAVGPSGMPLAITIQDIALEGAPPANVTFRLSTRWTRLSFEAREGEQTLPNAAFVAAGRTLTAGSGPFLGLPFQTVVATAPGGGQVAAGIRLGFEQWSDGELERTRSITLGDADTVLVAHLGGREVELQWVPEVVGGQPPGSPLPPGTLVTDPALEDGWVVAGWPVRLEARPRPGFRFVDWVGALAGAGNPVDWTFAEPETLRARFEVSFAFAPPHASQEVLGAAPFQWALHVTEATAPITWRLTGGVLPAGVTLNAQTGVLGGTPLDVGTFALSLAARDATGLEALATRELQVALPSLSDDALGGVWLGTAPGLSEAMEELMDRLGNRNGTYDLGDLRAYLLKRRGP
jgi:M6 family metalloprotease-like protein